MDIQLHRDNNLINNFHLRRKIKAKKLNWYRPLLNEMKARNLEMIQLIFDSGIDLSTIKDLPDGSIENEIRSLLCEKDNGQLFELFLKNGFDPNQIVNTSRCCLEAEEYLSIMLPNIAV
jgi:hypothetical protein